MQQPSAGARRGWGTGAVVAGMQQLSAGVRRGWDTRAVIACVQQPSAGAGGGWRGTVVVVKEIPGNFIAICCHISAGCYLGA